MSGDSPSNKNEHAETGRYGWCQFVLPAIHW
jgi:hypothetical protein